jgi:hypothetical protein
LFPGLRFPGLVRISLGIENSKEDVDKLIQVLGKIANPSLALSDTISESGNKGNPVISQAELKKQMNDFARNISTRVYSQL